MKRAILILMLSACEGEQNARLAAELAAGPISRCVATNNDAMCVDGHSVFSCTLDGIVWHVATCKRIGAMIPTPDQIVVPLEFPLRDPIFK